ncbi:MAG TPA: hypothetical protein VM010_04490 [Chitinophagaceae bacterium]|nr:hypothetical protein [Chitinophagaceae bacterium]
MPAAKLFTYEHKTQPLLPLRLFYKRVARNIVIALCVLALCLLIGTMGYHVWAGADWIDAFYNASMILSGMGPVPPQVTTVSGKLFSSFYALFSGVVFITNIGVILAPSIHRLFHRFHLQAL